MFYIPESFEWFSSQIKNYDPKKAHFFQLTAPLDEILNRRENQPTEVLNALKSNYEDTTKRPHGVYVDSHPLKIDTVKLNAKDVVQTIFTYLAMKHAQLALMSLEEDN